MANKNNATVNETANNQVATAEVAQAQQPVAAPATTEQQATVQVPAEIPQQTFAEKHPKLAAFGQEAKKWGKRIAIAGGAALAIWGAVKIGESRGFDKATDAYNSKQSGDDPEPDTSPDDENDLGEASYTDVTSDQ